MTKKPDAREFVFMDDLQGYMLDAIGQFINDPPTSDVQRGFLAAILAAAHDIANLPDEHPTMVAGYALLPMGYVRRALQLRRDERPANGEAKVS